MGVEINQLEPDGDQEARHDRAGEAGDIAAQRKPQITGASDTMQISTATPPRRRRAATEQLSHGHKPAISPGHSQLRSPT